MNKVYLLLLIGFAYPTLAQKEILLWPNGTPGLKSGVNVVEGDPTQSKDGMLRLRNITQPTLSVYKPKKSNGSAVIICPGGGYYILAINHEGHDIAKWFAERGYTAFVLKYRLPQDELFTDKKIRPLQDAQQAIRLVRSQAKEWGIFPDKIGIMGFSAGGHLAATASTHFDRQVGEHADSAISVRPDFSLLIYPVISFSDAYSHTGSRLNLIGPEIGIADQDLFSNEKQVTAKTPPAFLVHAFDDPIRVENSLAYVWALKKNNIPAEMHLYDRGGHGYGMTKKNRGPVETWPERLIEWLKVNNF